jgi:magnesium transporter
MGTMRLVVDAGEEGLPAEVGADRLGELLAKRENRLWLDISDPGPAEVELLRREFGFHELTLEEVTKPHERPRCDAPTPAITSSWSMPPSARTRSSGRES